MISRYAASALAYVKSPDSAGWTRKSACQGVYGKRSTDRVGVMSFGGLRAVDWGTQNISGIEIKLTFAKGGSNRVKTLGLHRGKKDAAGGSGASMIGEKIGDVSTGGTAYDAVRTIRFGMDQNAAAFDGLVRWLKESPFSSLVLYRDEHSSGSWSENYLSVTAAQILIDHEPAGSGGTLNANRVEAGQAVRLTIQPMETTGTLTHAVQWGIRDLVSEEENLGSLLTAEFTVPLDWLHQIPSAEWAEARCTLTTFIDGAVSAQRMIPFIVTVPDSVVPEFTPSAVPDGTQGGYWQFLSGAVLEIAGAKSFYGAQIEEVSIEGAEGVLASESSVRTPSFRQAGIHSYVFRVKDSRGRTTRQTVEIDVSALHPPMIDLFSVQRYSSFVDDAGQTVYKEDVSGAHVWVTLRAVIDAAGGNNIPAAVIEHDSERIVLPWTQGAEFACSEDREIISTAIPLNAARDFTLTVRDLHSSVSAESRVEASWATMHIAGSGYGVAFGGYSSGTEAAPEVRSYWPIYGPDGFALTAARTEPMHIDHPNFIGNAENMPAVSRIGGIVFLSGVLNNQSPIRLETAEVQVAVLPDWARPKFAVSAVQQGSSRRVYWLRIHPDGRVTISRNRAEDVYVQANANNQFNVSACWIAADAVR